MYTNDELIKKFKKFIRTEMEAIFFYLDNIDACNYEHNKEIIDKLVLESIDHQKILIKGLLALNKDTKGALSEDVKNCALQEEVGMNGLYQYVYDRTDNEKVKELLHTLIVWEKEHEKIAEGLK